MSKSKNKIIKHGVLNMGSVTGADNYRYYGEIETPTGEFVQILYETDGVIKPHLSNTDWRNMLLTITEEDEQISKGN